MGSTIRQRVDAGSAINCGETPVLQIDAPLLVSCDGLGQARLR